MTPPALPALAHLITKLMILLGIGIYSVFAGIMVRQEQLMAHVLEETFEPILRTLTIIHFLAAAGLFFLALVLL